MVVYGILFRDMHHMLNLTQLLRRDSQIILLFFKLVAENSQKYVYKKITAPHPSRILIRVRP